jgi:hypothetical protein
MLPDGKPANCPPASAAGNLPIQEELHYHLSDALPTRSAGRRIPSKEAFPPEKFDGRLYSLDSHFRHNETIWLGQTGILAVQLIEGA